jgi:hypothetical protein
VGSMSLSELRPGMVLAAPLFNRNGVMLLPRGTRLTAKHLDQFSRWGVRGALVETLDVDGADTQLDPELVEAIDEALDDKFVVQDDDELMAEVRRIVRRMTIEEALARLRSEP